MSKRFSPLLAASQPYRLLSRAQVYAALPSFPAFSYDAETDTDHISFPHTLDTYILAVEGAHSQEDHFASMAAAIAALTQEMSATALLFMGAGRAAWRRNPARGAAAEMSPHFLEALHVGPRFNGGIAVSLPQLPAFIPPLIRLIATAPALSEVYFTDEAQTVLGHLCRYGNLHLYLLSAGAQERFGAFVQREGMKDVTAESCTYSRYDVQDARTYVV